MIIGIAGTLASGKGAVVEYLKTKGFKHYSSSTTLKEVLVERGQPLTRDYMSHLAEELLAAHDGGILGINFDKAKKDKNAVLEAIHRQSEANYVRSQGGLIWGVDADLETRYRRTVARADGEKDAVTLDMFKEHIAREEEGRRDLSSNIRSVVDGADMVFMNNGTLDELYAQVDQALANLQTTNQSDYECAVDAQQYDSVVTDWENEGAAESPFRAFFYHHYLGQHLNCKGKAVVDIGSGTGSLTPLLERLGASKIFGIEPSQRNAAISKKLYPQMTVLETPLESVNTEEKFDVATMVMVFEHIKDPAQAFQKVRSLLNPGGMAYVIVSDKEYYLTPRFGYNIKETKVNDTVSVVRIQRPTGTLCDLVRPLVHYISAAKQGGFELVKQVPLVPTEKLLEVRPQYAEFAGKPTSHLLVLKSV